MRTEDKELTVTANVENLETIMSFIETELQAIDCSKKAMSQIHVAIDEIFANITCYAYRGEAGSVTVRVEIMPDIPAIVISFLDMGVPFNPLEIKEPKVTGTASERKIGGLGIYLVKNTMDEITYEYKDGKNILRIMKHVESTQ